MPRTAVHSRPLRSAARCGTDAGYHRHLRLGSVPCRACCDAHRAAERDRLDRLGLRSARMLAPCGTDGAYHRHIRHGEKACDRCLSAHRAYERTRYARRVAA